MKTLNYSLFIVFLLISIFTQSCETVGPPISTDRYAYIPITTGANAGLLRYSMTRAGLEQVTLQSVVMTSGVADNGIVLLEYADPIKAKFWGRCIDGTLIQVPIPSDSTGQFEYNYKIPPHINLNKVGHKAAYFMYYKPVGSSNLLDNRPSLILFNCGEWKMTIVNFDSVFADTSSVGKIDFCEPVGDFVVMNNDGSRAWITLRVSKYENNNFKTLGHIIYEIQNGILIKRFVQKTNLADPLLPLAFLNNEQLLILNSQTRIVTTNLDFQTQTEQLHLNNLLNNQNQVSLETSEIVVWGSDGIYLTGTGSNSFMNRVISFDEINLKYSSHLIEQTGRLTLSRDAQYIIFALKLDGNKGYDVFVVDRNGNNLRCLITEEQCGIPVISNEI